MSKHAARIVWRRESPDFSYDSYNRSHRWEFESGLCLAATAAEEFLGTPDGVDPEEPFVAAISSCHMLTFLAICARKRIIVDSYEDNAVGHLEEIGKSRLAVTRVRLDPVIVFGGETPDAETIRKLHHQSHEDCFIANSVTTEIIV